MSNTDTEKNPTDEYQARIIIAAMTNCRDQEQAAALVAQYMVLAPRISQVIDKAADLVEDKQYAEAVTLLDEMIAKAEQFSRPYPVAAVREVFGYDMAGLYFARAIAHFGASGSAEPAVLRDLDHAQSYPVSCFAELDPGKPATMAEFRTVVEAVQKGQKTYEARHSASPTLSADITPVTALWWGALFGLGVVLGSLLLSWIFGEGAITILVVPLLALALLFGVNRWALGRRLPFRLSPIFKLYLMGVVLGIGVTLMQQGLGYVLTALLTVMIAAIGFWLAEVRTPFLADFN